MVFIYSKYSGRFCFINKSFDFEKECVDLVCGMGTTKENEKKIPLTRQMLTLGPSWLLLGLVSWKESLEALPVDDGGAALIVLLLGDPHLLEGGEGSEDGASDPDGVLPLRRGDDLDLHG